MGARIRSDGTVLCAAMHHAEPGDIYLTDKMLYELAITEELIPTRTHLHAEGCDPATCSGKLIGASGSPLCGDGIWLRRNGSGAIWAEVDRIWASQTLTASPRSPESATSGTSSPSPCTRSEPCRG